MQAAASSPHLPPQRPGGVPFLHDYLAYQRNPLAFWLENGRFAPVTRVQLGPAIEYWIVTEPDLLQHILQTKAKLYPRERRLMKMNRSQGPELLFNTDNWEEWLWRRRLMQPAFHRKQIQQFATAMVDETRKLTDSWYSGEIINTEQMMKTLTMRIIGRTMFSVDVHEQTHMLQDSYEIASHVTFKRASAIWPMPLWMPTPHIRRLKTAVNRRITFLEQIVQSRYRDDGDPPGDLLDTLIAARLEENGRSLTAEDLVYEMSGIVFAGHDTTALTFTWLFYLLSQHPQIAQRLYDEIDTVLGQRNITIADLEQMPYTEWVILETMRLYPPIYLTIREADADDQFNGYHIPKGTSLVLNIRGMHRDPAHWPNPDAFDPERFGPERSNGRHKFAYLPFIHGPRKCMGDSFALMEMRLVVPTILQAFRFRYLQGKPAQEQSGFVMETEDGIPLQVVRR